MITTKEPSPELLSLIKAAASSLIGFAQLWDSIKKKGHDEGFSEPELQGFLRPLLKDNLGMSKDKIYYLFHKEERNEQSKEFHRQTSVKSAMNDAKKPIEQSDTAEHIGGEPITDDEVLPSTIVDISEKYDPDYTKENPLNKMKSDLTETEVFDWLKNRDNGISIIYWDSFGFRQWRNELTQMENRGIKSFKRLYYEV